MKFFHTALGVLTFIAMMAIATPAKAEVVFNEWHEFAFPLTDDSGCAGEDGVVSGVFHEVLSLMPNGGYSYHLNANGVWKGDESEAELLWRDNYSEVVPHDDFGNFFIGTISHSIKIIGGPLGQFRLKFTSHLTEINGEFVRWVDNFSTACKGN